LGKAVAHICLLECANFCVVVVVIYDFYSIVTRDGKAEELLLATA
jgi:hypothetical protein